MKKEIKLGAEADFGFSQTAIININRLLKLLKLRLASDGKVKSKDINNNIIYVDTCIFNIDKLVGFLVLSLSDFNQTPDFTYFTFEDTRFLEFFSEVLISGATLYALASQVLLEKGREYSFSDNGIIVDPPSVSEILETQYRDLSQLHWEKVKHIKHDIVHFNK